MRAGCDNANTATREPMGRNGRVWVPPPVAKQGFAVLFAHATLSLAPQDKEQRCCIFEFILLFRRSMRERNGGSDGGRQFHNRRLFLLTLCPLSLDPLSRCARVLAVVGGGGEGGWASREIVRTEGEIVESKQAIRLRRLLIDRSESRFQRLRPFTPLIHLSPSYL